MSEIVSDPDIRLAGSRDLDAIEALYRGAFPDEDLVPLVRALMREPGVLALVAIGGDGPVGHVAFSPCTVGEEGEEGDEAEGEDGEGGASAALLGPLAVHPDRQRRGIGGALIRDGLRRLTDAGTATVCVLGDPAYYGRHGFTPERDLAPPYKLPDAWRDAWQSRALAPDRAVRGTLRVPEPWRDPALWGP